MRTPLWPTLTLALAVLAAALAVIAGPLNPPPGPVSPTYKTLGEVEPRIAVQSLPSSPTALFVIASPGSYYLTASVTGLASKAGIEIAASNVTLDLSGFTLTGVPGALDGIRLTGPASNITIERGIARAWPGIAINLASATSCTLRSLAADDSGSGILTGARALISSCSARGNAVAGIATGETCQIIDCSSTGNGHDGFYLSDGAAADRCTASHNGGHGFYLDGDGCTIRNSVARSNALGGVTSIYSCSIEATMAEFNAGTGINSMGAATITDCVAHANDSGGILAADASRVSGCRVTANPRYGISVGSHCQVESNSCSGTHAFSKGPGAGLLATGAANRLDSNTLTDNDIGLKTLAPANLIIRNSAAGNTTAYDLSPNQTAGAIISGPGPIISPNPWANFEH